MSTEVKHRKVKEPSSKASSGKGPKSSSKGKKSSKKSKRSKHKDKGPTYTSIFLGILFVVFIIPSSLSVVNLLSMPFGTVTSTGKTVYRYDDSANKVIINQKAENGEKQVIPNWPFEAHFYTVDAKNSAYVIHYIDEGVVEEEETHTVVLLHDAPLWSYTYRNVIPGLTMSKVRVIAVDLVGFGKSDKPAYSNVHTVDNHVKWITELLHDKLELDSIVLFATGRSTLLAHALMVHNEKTNDDLFSGLVLGNPLIFSPESESQAENGVNTSVSIPEIPMSYVMEQYFAHYSPYMSVLQTVQSNINFQTEIKISEYSALEHPFSHSYYTAGWAGIADWTFLKSDKLYNAYFRSEIPTVVLATKNDELGSQVAEWLIQVIPGAKTVGLNHATDLKGMTYIQEDCPNIMSDKIKELLSALSTAAAIEAYEKSQLLEDISANSDIDSDMHSEETATDTGNVQRKDE